MDHRTKLAWGRKHIDALDEAIGVFVQSDPYVLSGKYDAEQADYVAWISDATPTPVGWSLMIGDIVHNLRSALDSLIYALAVRNLRRAPEGKEAKALQFPIVDAIGDWGAQDYRFASLHPEVRTAVYAVQPCHRTDRKNRHAL